MRISEGTAEHRLWGDRSGDGDHHQKSQRMKESYHLGVHGQKKGRKHEWREGREEGGEMMLSKGKKLRTVWALGRRNNFSCSQRTISEPHLKNKSPLLCW